MRVTTRIAHNMDMDITLTVNAATASSTNETESDSSPSPVNLVEEDIIDLTSDNENEEPRPITKQGSSLHGSKRPRPTPARTMRDWLKAPKIDVGTNTDAVSCSCNAPKITTGTMTDAVECADAAGPSGLEQEMDDDLPPASLFMPALKTNKKRKRKTSGGGVSCPVCLDDWNDIKADKRHLMCVSTCGHVFCSKCIDDIMKAGGAAKACPQCRKAMAKKSLVQLYF